MKSVNNVSWWNKGAAMVGLLGAGLVIAGGVPAFADPPDHARAYGYRQNRDRDRYDHTWSEHSRRKRRDRYDNDWNASYRNRERSWAYRDSDGDGVRNGRDRYPMNRHRH